MYTRLTFSMKKQPYFQKKLVRKASFYIFHKSLACLVKYLARKHSHFCFCMQSLAINCIGYIT